MNRKRYKSTSGGLNKRGSFDNLSMNGENLTV